jgi:hypothetical protein
MLGEYPGMIIFVFFQFFSILAISMATAAISKKSTFAIVAILNPQWPPKHKNPPIWATFGFQVDFVLAN